MCSSLSVVGEPAFLDGFDALDAFRDQAVDDPGDLIDAEDLLDDDGAVAWFLELPRSVDDVLAEVALFGTGAEAITLLESLHGRAMGAEHALQVAEAWERQARWLSVRTAQANLAFTDGRPAAGTENPRGSRREREAARRAQSSRELELALAVDCGEAFLRQVLLPQSRLLAGTLSATRDEVEAGRLSTYRARRICDKLAALADSDPDAARQIEGRVLPTAAEIKTASLTNKLRRLVLAARDPDEVLAEHEAGVANRSYRIDAEPAEPGLLGLHAQLPAETALAMHQAIEAKAAEFAVADQRKASACATHPHHGEVAPFTPRTRDQRLADALAWFVLGPDATDATRPARPRFLVQLTMSLPVLIGLQEGCAELPGYGPIPADLARAWAADADWQRFIHDPVTGHLIDDGPRYRQSARGRSFTVHRDVLDRFPGSNRRAATCDADHNQPFTGDATGGATASANLAMLGRPGHLAKTHNGWRVTGDANNTLTWTSPHGLTRTTTPHDYRDPESTPP